MEQDAALQQALKEAWNAGFDAAIQSLEELADEARTDLVAGAMRTAAALLRETKP